MLALACTLAHLLLTVARCRLRVALLRLPVPLLRLGLRVARLRLAEPLLRLGQAIPRLPIACLGLPSVGRLLGREARLRCSIALAQHSPLRPRFQPDSRVLAGCPR